MIKAFEFCEIVIERSELDALPEYKRSLIREAPIGTQWRRTSRRRFPGQLLVGILWEADGNAYVIWKRAVAADGIPHLEIEHPGTLNRMPRGAGRPPTKEEELAHYAEMDRAVDAILAGTCPDAVFQEETGVARLLNLDDAVLQTRVYVDETPGLPSCPNYEAQILEELRALRASIDALKTTAHDRFAWRLPPDLPPRYSPKAHISDHVLVSLENGVVTEDRWCFRPGGGGDWNCNHKNSGGSRVLAWCPKPEPYTP